MLNKMTTDKRVRFKSTPTKDEFIKVLRQRVNEYFEPNNITQYANGEMVFKTIFAIVAWLGFYSLIISDVLSGSAWLLMLGFLMLGFVNIFIAFNIMHDATHEAYSSNKKINNILGYSMNFIGANQYLFRRMHGAHHGYVNIYGIDVTLEAHGLFRFTPDEPYKPYHRWQHIYTFILYAFAMLQWVVMKDFKWFFGESHIGNQKNIKHPFSEYVILLISKAFYFGTTLALPLMLLSAPAWLIVLSWIGMHLLPGLTFVLIFQVTHVYDGTAYPLPDKDGNIDNNYALHVLDTTADFSRHNRLGSWLMGGINIHVIHHIFPTVCHVHYPALTKILKQVADEFGIVYQENPNFWVALKKHYQILKHLSKPDAEVQRYGASAAIG
ncbi:MAG: acyl-CoA desaturase [Lewinellaceae bacterium]|nr:acyl-CoA desaturase [Lewinellaceae bacterium]